MLEWRTFVVMVMVLLHTSSEVTGLLYRLSSLVNGFMSTYKVENECFQILGDS